MKKISEVSQIVGVSRRTLQYYDDEGIFPVERTVNNHRLYDQKALERIWQILIYKEMDFELKEIKQLLRMPDDQKDICFTKQIEKIRNQIIILKVQLKFITLVQVGRIALEPKEYSSKTYVRCIEEIREKIQKEIMNEKQGENRNAFSKIILYTIYKII